MGLASTMKPFGLLADVHAHDWSAFSETDSMGRNSRLMDAVTEIKRCAEQTRIAGGNEIWIAGDLFHTRGSVSPDVFNPIKDVLREEALKGMKIRGIPGNHDLASRETSKLSSAVQMLTDDGNCIFEHTPGFDGNGIAWVPWYSSPSEYMAAIEKLTADIGSVSDYDLLIHIGIDGTLSTMPDHGVDAAKLASFGFKRVWSGHYHQMRDFKNNVYSIGSPYHQTWRDVGTKSGWWIVHPDHVQWFASHAPSFIRLDGTEDPADLPLIVDGHYVEAKLGECDPKDVVKFRKLLTDAGAQGVIIDAQKPKITGSRTGVSAKSLSALDKSVMDYVNEKKLWPEVNTLCQSILAEAQTA